MDRSNFLIEIGKRFRTFNVVGLLGPRQCGKTTLAKKYIDKIGGIPDSNYFDLEDPLALSRLDNPKLTLEALKGLIVIDEVQRKPELFPLLRVLVDDQKVKRQFLILGSASRELIKQGSESLAGRINYLELTPFTLNEVGYENIDKIWLRGGYPLSYLAESDEQSNLWLKSYASTFLERDIPQLGFNLPAQSMRRVWTMLTHYHGQTMNYSEIGTALGLDDTTIRRYVDILAGTFMIRILRPWSSNLKKREVKAPKIFFRDSGIFHSLLGVEKKDELLTNPKLGASWEGLALEYIIRNSGADAEDCYFWGVHNQGELDLLIIKDGKRFGYEIKYSDSPKLSAFAKTIPDQLKLDEFSFVYPGDKTFPLEKGINAVGIGNLVG